MELSGFDLLEKGLEPANGGYVTTNPKELDATERGEISLLLTVPNVFQNGCKGSDAYGGTLGEAGGDGEDTPMPAPMRTATSLSKTSSAGAP